MIPSIKEAKCHGIDCILLQLRSCQFQVLTELFIKNGQKWHENYCYVTFTKAQSKSPILSAGVNFINDLCARFLYESGFLVPKFRTKADILGLKFLAPKFCTKIARKKHWWNWLLVLSSLQVISNQSSFFQKVSSKFQSFSRHWLLQWILKTQEDI